jgi:SAM-dependent methyltransferase
MKDGLPAGAFQRLDETPDAEFYAAPRLVTHIDDGAIAAVTALYREYFPAGGAILDLMSSWVSHLPPEASYRRVTGLGMNAEELAANPRLDAWVVHDLNAEPRLPFADGEFDAAGCCVSIDYLVRPVEVLCDLARVLRPDAPVVITFSNRRFPTKVIALWEVTPSSWRTISGRRAGGPTWWASTGAPRWAIPSSPSSRAGPRPWSKMARA